MAAVSGKDYAAQEARKAYKNLVYWLEVWEILNDEENGSKNKGSVSAKA